jgi:chemotaxis protein methyltransferase CheR
MIRARYHGYHRKPRLGIDEYRLLRDLVSERLGIWFAPESRTSLERRLRSRLAARGLVSFSDYYQMLQYGLFADEWDEVAELLTTHETYFFREDYQLRAFQEEVLPMLFHNLESKRQLFVWSAGCSTGEEAYTIAILVLESGLFDGWDVRIFGSDLSKRCIAAARRGIYASPSFRATPDDRKRKWFTFIDKAAGKDAEVDSANSASGAFSVVPAVRALCRFGQMNILDEERVHLVSRCNVIFCRNVLIYFDALNQRRAIEMLHERLNPGGVLLLGHAESLLNVSTAFELLHLKEDLVYRKPIVTTANAVTR